MWNDGVFSGRMFFWLGWVVVVWFYRVRISVSFWIIMAWLLPEAWRIFWRKGILEMIEWLMKQVSVCALPWLVLSDGASEQKMAIFPLNNGATRWRGWALFSSEFWTNCQMGTYMIDGFGNSNERRIQNYTAGRWLVHLKHWWSKFRGKKKMGRDCYHYHYIRCIFGGSLRVPF